ncbi:excitatory amino acid transporter 3-like isoform X1 [Dermacentor albipictus]|uniref:excitatory amino acid transporter 3-like isoform X1 n=2 Tax=Dermacentor albipictus TaxID=60249 RepID=UPI0031FCA6C3
MSAPRGELNEDPGSMRLSFRGGIYRSTADGSSMSTTNLAEDAAPPAVQRPAALPSLPAQGSKELEAADTEDTESAGGAAPTPRGGACRTFLRHNRLTVATIAAVVAGIVLGIVLRPLGPFSKRQLMYINFPGEMFLRMLRGLILPLITSSMVAAVGALDARLSGRIGLRAVVYYFSTTFLAIVLGIVLVTGLQPGAGDSDASTSKESKARLVTTADTLMDLIRNAFPPNVIEACVTQFSTIVIKPPGNATNTSMYDWDYKTVQDPGTNILGLIVFCIALGATVGQMGESGKPLLDIFTCLSDAMMIITKLVVWFSPVGVMFLVMAKMLEMQDFSIVAGQVGLYTVTVLLGLLLHGFVVLPLIYWLVMRQPPFRFLLDMLQAIATAFGTASSSATLPVTISTLEDKVKVDPKVVRFCIPIGATINMDGTALYEAVAAIFIAQVRRVPLDVGKVIAISVTATAASIGAAGIPQAGLVTMVMVLNAVGLPADDITLIIVVDWFLDRFRTAINVLGDAVGACVVERLSLKDLEKPHISDGRGSKDTVITSM